MVMKLSQKSIIVAEISLGGIWEGGQDGGRIHKRMH
jgi:hypothetical protein